MIEKSETACRHQAEAELLQKALDGDMPSVNKVLKYLSSSNKFLRRIMQEAIHDFEDQELWKKLLHCLAVQQWNDQQDCPRRVEVEASKRIDLSIEEIFVEDESAWEEEIKDSVLQDALGDESRQLRWTGAYLLGMRGDLKMIPFLAEMIDEGTLEWQMQAIKALVKLDRPECCPCLVNALSKDQERVHQEALRALSGMGEKARLGWLGALSHPDSHIRWHAARGLGQIGDASSVHILAEGLLDPNHAVRWATADLLGYLGEVAVPAVLDLIIQKPLAEPLRQAAYHALHAIAGQEVQERLEPLVKALRSPTARLEAPVEAQRLLHTWVKG